MRKIATRPVERQRYLQRLRSRHAQLEERISAMERRLHLTTHETLAVRRLKKLKLAAKDAMTAVQRES